MAPVGKFFNKLNKDTSKFFNKAGKDVKMFGRGARKFGAQIGGAIGSVSSQVGKAASDLEKAVAGTALAPELSPILKGAELAAGVGKSAGTAIKAGSEGKTKAAVKAVESGVMGVTGLQKMTRKK